MTDDAISEAERKMQFLYALRSKGVMDKRVLTAMEKVDRGAFVTGHFSERAYEDMPLPISCGQTISQPSVVGMMTQALDVTPRDKVLEVGTGSGYQAAVLAALVNRVHSVEIIPELAESAERRLARLGIDNVAVKTGDGYHGWPEAGPFDGIIVTAVGPDIPPALVAQLKPGGRMVLPVGTQVMDQNLTLVTRRADGGTDEEQVLPVAFVPLTGDR